MLSLTSNMSVSVTAYVLIIVMFPGSCHVFPLPLSFTQVTCFCSQLHPVTNHLPTEYSFQVLSQSLRIPHFPFMLIPRIVKSGFAIVTELLFIIFFNHSLVSLFFATVEF